MGLMDVLGLGKAAGDAIASPITAIGNVFDKLCTSDDERMAAEAVMTKIRQRPDVLQIEVNKLEAQHRSIFVAGWRPFVGWVCGAALAWRFLGHELVSWGCTMWAPDVVPPVLSGSGDLITVLLAILGMSGLRTYEKREGISK